MQSPGTCPGGACVVHVKVPQGFRHLALGCARTGHDRVPEMAQGEVCGDPGCCCLGGGSGAFAPALTESQEHLVLLSLQVELIDSQEGIKLLLGYMGKDILRRGRKSQ